MSNTDILILAADTSVLDDDSVFESVYLTVSADRRLKTDRLRFRKDRNLSLGAEYLLMCACRECGIDYPADAGAVCEGGKNIYRAGNLFYNLSHSEQRAMCAVSRFPVGCDTEYMGEPDMQIAGRFFAPEENALIASLSGDGERRELFYRLWTLKESYIKCCGEGMKIPLRSFSVCFDDLGTAFLNNEDGADFALYEFNFDDGYRYSCCVNNAAAVRKDIDESFQWKRIGTDN